MDHSGLMSMGMGMFQPANKFIDRLFWYLVVSVVAVGVLGQICRRCDERVRLNIASKGWTGRHPSVPTSHIAQYYATTRTLFRELAYPQGLYFSRQSLQWLNPPSLGQCLLLVAYWTMITIMICSDSILPQSDPFYYEKLGYRGAWASIMQLPLVVLLANKINILGYLIGSSYEKLNWLHRWVSRTMLVTTAIHGGFFLRQYIRADYLQQTLSSMPFITYGVVAGGLLLFMNLVGMAPLRHQFYETYVVVHLASIALFLWCLYKHVPSYAMWHVWLAIGLIALDRTVRLAWLAYRNVRLRIETKATLVHHLGYSTEIQALPGETTRVTINNIPWKWSPGQHIYLCIPRLGLLQAHPFTISNTAENATLTFSDKTSKGSNLPIRHVQLEIRAHAGFSRRLYELASDHSEKLLQVRSFVQGPFGTYPRWNSFETLLLISASTGGSFTMPILQSIISDPGCVQKCHFILSVRERSQCSCYLLRLRSIARAKKRPNLHVTINVAITGTASDQPKQDGAAADVCCCREDDIGFGCCCGAEGVSVRKSSSVNDNSSNDESSEPEAQNCCSSVSPNELTLTDGLPVTTLNHHTQQQTLVSFSDRPYARSSLVDDVNFLARKPLLADVIRETVEAAHGETCVVVCGGKPLSSYVRNVVAQLSDERAVHKGTGAQGIALWTETFGL